LPAMASEQMLHAVEVFASFFVPFYFFSAGLGLERADFTLPAVALGVIFFAVMVPVLVGTVALQRRVALGEAFSRSFRVAVPMLPTLVFTLVIAEILRSEFNLEPMIFGGLIVYTMLNTVLPGVLLHAPVPEFDTPELPPTEDTGVTAISTETPVAPEPAGGS
jgi:Kef-type K+ transport system membrane component KefB